MVEIEVFTEISSLSCFLAIPLLQIVIKHLKISLFLCFLRGIPFSDHFWMTASASHQKLLVNFLQSEAFVLCEYSYRIGFFKSMLMKIK